MFSRFLGRKEAPAPTAVTTETVATEATAAPSAPLPLHTMPNGLIKDRPLEYTFDHAFNGSVVKLALHAGPGHSAVTAFPTPYEPAAVPMTSDGDIWVTELKGFKEGDKFEVHFLVENDGHQADNSNARHVIEVPASTVLMAAEGGIRADPLHRMPNGLIKGNPVEYSLATAFDGSLLRLAVNAGAGHHTVTVFPTPHDPAAVEMRNVGDEWLVELPGFKEGDEVEFHFVIQHDGEQVDNSTARHKLQVPAATTIPLNKCIPIALWVPELFLTA